VGVVFFADVGELGGQKSFVAPALDGFAEELFVFAQAVGVGGVQKINSQIQSAEKSDGGFGVVTFTVKFTHTMQSGSMRETSAPCAPSFAFFMVMVEGCRTAEDGYRMC
jgi:hypothetical protein